jgi:hypothetical protein
MDVKGIHTKYTKRENYTLTIRLPTICVHNCQFFMFGGRSLSVTLWAGASRRRMRHPLKTAVVGKWVFCRQHCETAIASHCRHLCWGKMLKCIWNEISYFLKRKNSWSCSVTYISVSWFYGLFPRYINLFDM